MVSSFGTYTFSVGDGYGIEKNCCLPLLWLLILDNKKYRIDILDEHSLSEFSAKLSFLYYHSTWLNIFLPMVWRIYKYKMKDACIFYILLLNGIFLEKYLLRQIIAVYLLFYSKYQQLIWEMQTISPSLRCWK